MVNPGRYRHLAQLYNQPAQDDFGGADREPELVREMWVNLKPVRASESNENQQQTSLNRYRVTTPWFPKRPNSSQHFVTLGATYEIEGVVNIDEQNMEYELTAVRRENCA